MHAIDSPARPRGLALIYAWPRVRVTLAITLLLGGLLGHGWQSGLVSLLERTLALGFVGLTMFGLFEQWPRTLPPWLARWALQVLAVGLSMPIATFVIYQLSTDAGAVPFWEVEARLEGFMALSMVGVLIAPWVALWVLVQQREALVQEKDALVREQALAFDLERSEFERRALDARLNLLQAQVAPHFLFNTLANVQQLVETSSPQAPAVLRSLIAYLRAAVPRLHENATTLGQELQLVRAYLELMHMRMPDRLQFAIDAAPAALAQRCPPMTLLTLVENAVRHGIDPAEDGGRIDIEARLVDSLDGRRCLVRVSDTGVGLDAPARAASPRPERGLGTGLQALRERLQIVFGDGARLTLTALEPHGARAELDLPAQS